MSEEGAPPAPVEFRGVTYKPLADGKYDAIILGTGLKECILSGLLSVKGKKVRREGEGRVRMCRGRTTHMGEAAEGGSGQGCSWFGGRARARHTAQRSPQCEEVLITRWNQASGARMAERALMERPPRQRMTRQASSARQWPHAICR
jgi:hypothetical protein